MSIIGSEWLIRRLYKLASGTTIMVAFRSKMILFVALLYFTTANKLLANEPEWMKTFDRDYQNDGDTRVR